MSRDSETPSNEIRTPPLSTGAAHMHGLVEGAGAAGQVGPQGAVRRRALCGASDSLA